METKEKPILYYIKGVEGRQEECIKALEAKGGQNADNLDGTCDLPCIYFIDEENVICVISPNETFGKFVMHFVKHFGTELHLQENHKVQKWEDIKKTKGWYFTSDSIVETDYEDIVEIVDGIHIPTPKDIFATEQQAKSAQAAAMISQIREHGKDVYGELPERYSVDKTSYAFVIVKTAMNSFVIECGCTYHGGLLRFQTQGQAELFIENNRELVEEYLKTF